jgi:flagellar motor switch protein FliG
MPQNFNAPELSPSLERSLGDAIEKMLDPEHAKQTGQLSPAERRAILALNTINARFFDNSAESVVATYIEEFIQTSLSDSRQRAKEMVDILKEVQQYNQKNWINRIKDTLSSPFR